MKEQILQPVREILELLVAGKYAEVESRTAGVRLSGEDIAKAISDYGRRLVMPPEAAFELLDVVQVRNMRPLRWSIIMPLWTHEEGRSDLSLEITIIYVQNIFRIEVDGIHVL